MQSILIFLVSLLIAGCTTAPQPSSEKRVPPVPASLDSLDNPIEVTKAVLKMAPGGIPHAFVEISLGLPERSGGDFRVLARSTDIAEKPPCNVEEGCIARLLVRASTVNAGLMVMTFIDSQHTAFPRCVWRASYPDLTPETEGLVNILEEHGLPLVERCWKRRVAIDKE